MATRIEQILALHRPEAWREPMVYSVWQDGEITVEKGGDLFGQRNLHMVACGDSANALDPINFPSTTYVDGVCKNGRIFVDSRENASFARRLILGN